jgi:hypothetical protein
MTIDRTDGFSRFTNILVGFGQLTRNLANWFKGGSHWFVFESNSILIGNHVEAVYTGS